MSSIANVPEILWVKDYTPDNGLSYCNGLAYFSTFELE